MKGLSSIAVFLKEHFKVQTEKIATFSFPVHTGILKSHCISRWKVLLTRLFLFHNSNKKNDQKMCVNLIIWKKHLPL